MSQKNNRARVSFLIKLKATGATGLQLYLKDSGTGVFCEFCEISTITFLYRTPLVVASESTNSAEDYFVCFPD